MLENIEVITLKQALPLIISLPKIKTKLLLKLTHHRYAKMSQYDHHLSLLVLLSVSVDSSLGGTCWDVFCFHGYIIICLFTYANFLFYFLSLSYSIL